MFVFNPVKTSILGRPYKDDTDCLHKLLRRHMGNWLGLVESYINCEEFVALQKSGPETFDIAKLECFVLPSQKKCNQYRCVFDNNYKCTCRFTRGLDIFEYLIENDLIERCLGIQDLDAMGSFVYSNYCNKEASDLLKSHTTLFAWKTPVLVQHVNGSNSQTLENPSDLFKKGPEYTLLRRRFGRFIFIPGTHWFCGCSGGSSWVWWSLIGECFDQKVFAGMVGD